MSIKMIVSDMDGTLLNSYFQITDESANIIKKIQDKGIIFTIASGRSHYMMNKYYKVLDMYKYSNGYMIGLNGIELYSFQDNKLDKCQSLTCQQTIDISKSIIKLNLLPILMYDQETIIIQEFNNQKASTLLKLLNTKYQGAFPKVQIKDLNDIDPNSVNKFCILNGKTNIKEAIYQLKKKINNQDIEVLEVGGEWIEIMPTKINKANRIKEIMQKEHIKSDEIMVFGDSQNDIQMLKMTTNSYAMINASADVKASAHYIADSHDQNGVVKILKNLL